ncbi:Gfo/Idh/MocA family protein [Granulicella tundricola]|uniref:Oxidoreductase domain protein n=1 Tax=Granulicella tundricola (strain ATCC BAA-1859 / DSM 23138 / MP5ACTX9) TaxID=1198114 RepID=E8X0F0_GRATM|nr:Gfo/Idh/MocA family oxidoreductase [Granulicella tundricola]ADW67814.1 oxidoreductase domain protein [Granulicella tundricola MP5ACTX9]
MFKRISIPLTLAAATLLSNPAPATAQSDAKPVRVAIIGLVHGHVMGLFSALPKNTNVQLVGIVESDKALSQKYAARYHLAQNLFYTSSEPMFAATHPDAVLVYSTIKDHRKIIEDAASHNVSSMVEKPLATTLEDALAIRAAARAHHVQVLTNYETTWYASNTEALNEAASGKLGTIRKVVVHDGHEGPKEIGVGPEWLPWLTDPIQNGAGALFDFGCYGADMVTVMMHGQAPLSVTAVTQTDKPGIYPHVDDDATVILRYPGAQAVLMPSWDWSFARKDMEVYGMDGYAITVASDGMRVRYKGEKEEARTTAPALPQERSNSLDYLAAAIRGQIKPGDDMTSLPTNMVVVQILAAARESARTGKTIDLKPLAP